MKLLLYNYVDWHFRAACGNRRSASGAQQRIPARFCKLRNQNLLLELLLTCLLYIICDLFTTMSGANLWILKAPGAATPPSSACKLRLFCFPQAGSGAWMYHKFAEGLPPWVEVCAIQAKQ